MDPRYNPEMSFLKRLRESSQKKAKIKQWSQELYSESSAARLYVLREMLSSGYPEISELLVIALADPNLEVMTTAARALVDHQMLQTDGFRRGVEKLKFQLKHSPIRFRRQAIAKAFGYDLLQAEGMEVLIAALLDPDSEVRKEAVWSLGSIRHPDTVEPLCTVLRHDTDQEVRVAAANALGRIENPSANEILLHAGQTDPDPSVRTFANEAYARIQLQTGKAGTPEAPASQFLTALKDGRTGFRLEAIRALSQLKVPEAIEPLVDLLMDSTVKQYACGALDATNKNWREIPYVQNKITEWHEQLKEADNNIRVAALHALRLIGTVRPDSVVPLLLCEAWDVRVAASMALDETHKNWKQLDCTHQFIINASATLSNSQASFGQRSAAVDALHWIGSPEVVPALRSVADDANQYLAGKAKDALKEMNIWVLLRPEPPQRVR